MQMNYQTWHGALPKSKQQPFLAGDLRLAHCLVQVGLSYCPRVRRKRLHCEMSTTETRLGTSSFMGFSLKEKVDTRMAKVVPSTTTGMSWRNWSSHSKCNWFSAYSFRGILEPLWSQSDSGKSKRRNSCDVRAGDFKEKIDICIHQGCSSYSKQLMIDRVILNAVELVLDFVSPTILSILAGDIGFMIC